MKEQKKPNAKLRLNKTTITRLNDHQMNNLVGGVNLNSVARFYGEPSSDDDPGACTGTPLTQTIKTIKSFVGIG